jgi:hypothetical protein
MFKQVLEDVIILPTMDDHWQLFRFSKIQSEIEKLNLFIGYLLVTDHDHIQPRYNPLFQLYGFKTGDRNRLKKVLFWAGKSQFSDGGIDPHPRRPYMGASIVYPHTIKSFENSFWIFLPDSIITVDVKHRQPAKAFFSHCRWTSNLEAPKSRERPSSHTQEPIAWIGNVRSSYKTHMNIWVQVSVSIRNYYFLPFNDQIILHLN